MSTLNNPPVIAEGLPVTFRDQTIWRDPGTFERSLMVNIDFDETCFTTFISSGDGIEVHTAYEKAVEEVLGKSAKQDFSGYGGLSNRAPLDVIQGLLVERPSLIVHALDHAKEFFSDPVDKTDIGTGMIARFAMRGIVERDELTTRAITEMLVIRKKEKLMPQISEEWPMSVKGFEDTWQWLYEKRNEGGAWSRVHTAIVSSGHTDFIQKVMERSGLPHPDVYMTDDEMRRQVEPRTKPDPFALQLVRNAWMSAYLVPAEMRTYPAFVADAKQREVYIGDDKIKDGEMAANDGMRFIHHRDTVDSWRKIKKAVIDAVDNEFSFAA